jgi:serine protease Do
MYEVPKGQTNEAEQIVLRKLRVWIVGLGLTCLIVGIGIGAMLSGRPIVAQTDAQIARAPEALSASFAEIARRVEPAVVNIDTVQAPPETARGDKKNKNDDGDEDDDSDSMPNLPPGHPLLDMLRRRAMRPIKGVGSGFIVDPKGYIITNQHVIEGASRITVKLQSGEELRGRVIGQDEETDIAIVKVDAGRDLPFVKIGNSDDLQVGDWVLAIGSPFGLDQTVTAGIISTLQRQTPGSTNFQQFIQTDAAINRGNSGGPLVNMRGEVIGVNSQIATTTGDYNGIGFALPSKTAEFVYHQIAERGKVSRGYLGIYLEQVKSQYARVYNLPDTKGAIVRDFVDPQSPGAKAGLQKNDIITELNGQPILGTQDLINKVATTPVGQTVQLTYLREANGKLERGTASVTLAERPARGAASEREKTEKPKSSSGEETNNAPVNDKPTLGLKLSVLTNQIAKENNLQGVSGLYVKEVDPSGVAFDNGIREGMVIEKINRVSINSFDDFERVFNALKPGDPIVLNVADNSTGRIVQTIIQFTYQ